MDNNITMEKTEKEVTPQQPQQPDLNNLVIADENTALNVMVSFLHMAQKRGAFIFKSLLRHGNVFKCL